MINACVNINRLTNSKESTLHKCARWDRKEAAIVLLEIGVNPIIKNSDGKKAFDITLDHEIKFLLEYYYLYKAIKRNENYLSINE